jgi:hypothetical protein
VHAPTRASARAHWLDVLFFRLLATGGLIHEIVLTPQAEWPILVGAIWLFFMPDLLRGKDSIAARALIAFSNRQAPP